MGEHYGQLTLKERCTIARLHEGGQSIREIAAALDRSPSSVSRELKRNGGAHYKPAYAQNQADARRWKGCRLERDAEVRSLNREQNRTPEWPQAMLKWLCAHAFRYIN